MWRRECCFPLSFREFLDSTIHRTRLSTMRTATTATRVLSTLTYDTNRSHSPFDAYLGSCSVRDCVKYGLKEQTESTHIPYVPMRRHCNPTPIWTVPVMPQSSVHTTDVLLCIQNICDTLASIFTKKGALLVWWKLFTHLKGVVSHFKILPVSKAK